MSEGGHLSSHITLPKRPPSPLPCDVNKRTRGCSTSQAGLPSSFSTSMHISPSCSVDKPATATDDKQVEFGFLPPFGVFNFVLRFEGSPVWLPALDTNFVHFIHVPQFPTWTAFQHFLLSDRQRHGIYIHATSLLTPDRFKFDDTPSVEYPTLHLHSGSLAYLCGFPPVHSPVISILNNHLKCRKLPSAPFILHRLTHKVVGGVTTFETLWFSHNVSFTPSTTTLRRKISSVIDHSLRPTRCIQDHHASSFLEASKSLPFCALDSSIVYRTPFCASGLGVRPLSSQELHVAFGLPSPFHNLDLPSSTFSSLVPIQILDALLLPALRTLFTPRSPPSVPRFELSPPCSHL